MVQILRKATSKKPVSAIDIAPTIAHILDVPRLPKNSEGAVLYDIFE